MLSVFPLSCNQFPKHSCKTETLGPLNNHLPSSSQPLAIPSLLGFSEFQKSRLGIFPYLVFCDQLFPLSGMSSRFEVCWSMCQSFPFYSFPLYVCSLSADVCCFYLLAIVNYVCVNVGVQAPPPRPCFQCLSLLPSPPSVLPSVPTFLSCSEALWILDRHLVTELQPQPFKFIYFLIETRSHSEPRLDWNSRCSPG